MLFDIQLKMQQMLREENYQLKNEITDLKNAFDLNRDILKIISGYNHRTDPQHSLLMQIITRLTTVNNQAMLSSIQLIQQKNVLKQENLRLNMEVKMLEDRLEREVEHARVNCQPTESKMLLQDQFNNLNRELLAANEERITREQEVEYWRQKWTKAQQENGLSLQHNESTYENTTKSSKIKRKYESNEMFKFQLLLRQAHKENRRLKNHIQQLQNRIILLIKAFNISQESLQPPREDIRAEHYQTAREEVRLLKYALNDISVQRREDQYVLTITQRFKGKDKMNNTYLKDRRSSSWPKQAKPQPQPQRQRDRDTPTSRMQERQY